MKRPAIAESCQGKKKFGFNQAHSVAKSMRRRFEGECPNAYRCSHCGWWHVGNHVAGKMPASRPIDKERGHGPEEAA